MGEDNTTIDPTDSILQFSSVCALLDELEWLLSRFLSSKLNEDSLKIKQARLVERWALVHRDLIYASQGTLCATLSLLFPKLRRDRVYALKELTLSRALGVAVGLGPQLIDELQNWRTSHKTFENAVETLMKSRVHALQAILIRTTLHRRTNYPHLKSTNVSIP
jgi:hypothetical protein